MPYVCVYASHDQQHRSPPDAHMNMTMAMTMTHDHEHGNQCNAALIRAFLLMVCVSQGI